MLKVNDKVVYNATGVYKIVDIRQEKDINNREILYYVLELVFSNNLTVKVPVDNPNLSIRRIITREQALSLIAAMPDQDTQWIDNDRERNERFKAALKTDDNTKLIKIIKAIYAMKQEKANAEKKLLKADEDIMRAAEKSLYEELAAALDITPEEVLPFIMDQVS